MFMDYFGFLQMPGCIIRMLSRSTFNEGDCCSVVGPVNLLYPINFQRVATPRRVMTGHTSVNAGQVAATSNQRHPNGTLLDN